ncbi:hypothetical protein LG284_10520 [Citricoccus nitrophenolicus]
MADQMLIPRYMRALDGNDPAGAMELVEPDVSFNIVLPKGTVSGSSREDLQGYVSGRPPVVRRHNILRTTRSGDFETVYGVVTDDGLETGAFLASARISARGLLQRYLVYFDLDVRLFELDEATPAEQAEASSGS